MFFTEPTDNSPEKPSSVNALTGSWALLEQILAEKEFARLGSQWRLSRDRLSSADDEICGESKVYQEIIGLGPRILPALLKAINQPEPEPWFWALAAISRENPVPEESQGNLPVMRDAWLAWGRTRNLTDA